MKLKAFGLINALITVIVGIFLLSSSSAQVIDIPTDSFAKTDLVTSSALTDVGFTPVGEDTFVREITKPIGRVHVMGLDSVKSCTGTLIREDIVLTSSTCLPDDQAITSANFRLGYLSEAQSGDAFSVEVEPVGYNSDLGYMLLKVDSAAVVNYGFLPLYLEDAEVGSSLKLIQHALSAPMSLSDECEITASDGNLFEHNCHGGLVFDKFGYPIGMQLEEGLGISLRTLANSNKIIAEMYNLTSDSAVNIDAIDEGMSFVSTLRSSAMSETIVSEEASAAAEVSELAPVNVETTITTTPLETTASESGNNASGNNSMSNNSIGNTSSSLAAPAQVAWSILSEGSQGSADQPAVYVIQSQAKFSEIWTLANGNFTPMPTMPSVDFSNNTIIAVFLGIKPSGGHSVEIANMVNKATGLDVSLQINEPGAGMIATMALTSPWVMVEVTGAPVQNLSVIDSATGAKFVSIIR